MQIASLFASIGADTSGLQRGLKDAENQISKTAQGIEKSGESFNFAAMATGFNQALEIVNKIGDAIKAAYAAASEGAAIEYAAIKFDRLSQSIGTTSELLLGDMKSATRGMMSDAQLMGSAGDLMALGLAKSHDEAVRLTNVAGALGMNMNQLVLTLTNQTTMRFDALGVSVDGFKEKVKALEDAGMSANDAFTEAFLQQAEEQIDKVGSIAETSAGKLKMMESAFANLGDAIKLQLATTFAEFAPVITELGDSMTENITVGQDYKTTMNTIQNLMKTGLVTGTQYKELLREMGVHSGMGAITAQQHQIALDFLNEAMGSATKGTQDWADANYDSAEGMAAARAATLAQKTATEELTEAELEAANAAIAAAEAQAKMNAEVANLKSLDANYKGIIDLAYEYSDILADQQDLQIERDKLISQGWSDQSAKVKDLDAQIAGLDATMAELANKVTLDMFEATIAIGGVTEAELSAYMQMAIDMGYMSEEGAKAAMAAYGNAIATINQYEIDEKTGNVVIDAKEAYATLVMIQQMQIADKNANINIFTNYYNTTHGYDPYENLPPPSSGGSNPSLGTGAPALPPKPGKGNLGRAAGGDVIGGTPYIVGERGPELFVPNANGQIIPNNELSDYATGAVINNYNLTMPTTARAEDIRMAFELMEAWNR